MRGRYQLYRSCAEQLRSTRSGWERLPLLIELSGSLHDYRPSLARDYAVEALDIAKGLGDRYWTARASYDLALAAIDSSNFSEILFYLRQASSLFKEVNEIRRKAIAELATGSVWIAMGRVDDATDLLHHVHDYFIRSRDYSYLVETLLLLGQAGMVAGDCARGLRYYTEGLQMSRRQELDLLAGRIYRSLGAAYERIGEREYRQKYLRLSLSIAKQQHTPLLYALSLTDMGRFYIERNLYQHAETYLRRAGTIYRCLQYRAHEAMVWQGLGDIHWKRGNVRDGFRYYKRGMMLVSESEHILVQGKLYESIGKLYVSSGEYRRGLHRLQKGLQLLENYGDPYHLYHVHGTLAKAAETSGDTELSLKHHKLYIQIKENYLDGYSCLVAGRTEAEGKVRRLQRQLLRERKLKMALQKEVEEKEVSLTSLTLQLVQTGESLRKHWDSRKREREAREEDERENKPEPVGPDTDWELFARHFCMVHREFYYVLMQKYPELTPTEVKVCSLIRVGHCSSEIAELLSVSKRTVDRHRENIRCKLGLGRRESLTQVIQGM